MHDLALFLAASTILAVTPGPGLFYVAARSLAGGRAEGVASCAGTGLGGLVHVLAGSVGVSALVLASATLFGALKLAGAAYLIWIGVRTIRSARTEPGTVVRRAGVGRAFREGVLVEALNPKTAAFFLAFLPQFIDPAVGGVAAQFAILGMVSVGLNTLADLGVALAAGRLGRGTATHARLIRRMRLGSGVGLVALGLGLGLARRPG